MRIFFLLLLFVGCKEQSSHGGLQEWLATEVNSFHMSEINQMADKYDLVKQIRDKLLSDDGKITVKEYRYISDAKAIIFLLENEHYGKRRGV